MMVSKSSPITSGLLGEPHADRVVAEAECGNGLLTSADDELNAGLILPLLLEERKGLDGIGLRLSEKRGAPRRGSRANRTAVA